MSVHRLIYISKRTLGLGADDVAQILESARRNNAPREVTGMLIVTESMFIQALEGDAGAVHEIFGKIMPDPRHTDVEVISDASAPSRAFADWSMGFSEQSDEALKTEADLADVLSKEALFDALGANRSIATRMLSNLATKNSA